MCADRQVDNGPNNVEGDAPNNGVLVLAHRPAWGFGNIPPPPPPPPAPVAEAPEVGDVVADVIPAAIGDGDDVDDVDALAVAFAEADEWDAFAGDEEEEEEEEVEEEDEEEEEGPDEVPEDDFNIDDLDQEDPVVDRLRTGFEHLDQLRAEVDDLDGHIPVGEIRRGDPGAVRARANLLLAEEEIRGAFRSLWESRQLDREVAALARQGCQYWQDEVRRLVALLRETQAGADVARERAHANATSLEEARLEVALLRRRLADAGL